MGFFANLFSALFKANDWSLIWAQSCRWTVNGREVSRCFYEIHYSASRNRYVLKMSGDEPEEHRYCRKARKLLAHLAHFHDLFGDVDTALEESLKYIQK